jgi:hypothetical protein
MFANRKLFVAKAPKETVIKFLLEKFGCNLLHFDDFETDNFRTFSEIRRQNPIHIRAMIKVEHIQIGT